MERVVGHLPVSCPRCGLSTTGDLVVDDEFKPKLVDGKAILTARTFIRAECPIGCGEIRETIND